MFIQKRHVSIHEYSFDCRLNSRQYQLLGKFTKLQDTRNKITYDASDDLQELISEQEFIASLLYRKTHEKT
jgi:hypothetical protein